MNPAHYCYCGVFIGRRGFCSKACHDEYYNNFLGDEVDEE